LWTLWAIFALVFADKFFKCSITYYKVLVVSYDLTPSFDFEMTNKREAETTTTTTTTTNQPKILELYSKQTHGGSSKGCSLYCWMFLNTPRQLIPLLPSGTML